MASAAVITLPDVASAARPLRGRVPAQLSSRRPSHDVCRGASSTGSDDDEHVAPIQKAKGKRCSLSSERQGSRALSSGHRRRSDLIDDELERLRAELKHRQRRKASAELELRAMREAELKEREKLAQKRREQQIYYRSVVKVQALARGFIGRTRLAKMLHDHMHQKHMVDMYTPLLYRQMREMVHHAFALRYTDEDRYIAAVRLQAWWRMLLARRFIVVALSAVRMGKLQQQMASRATKLQSHYRRMKTQRLYKDRIQERVEEHFKRQQYERQIVLERIITLQNAFRRQLAWRTANRYRADRCHSAVAGGWGRPPRGSASTPPGWPKRSRSATPSTAYAPTPATPSDLPERSATATPPIPLDGPDHQSRVSLRFDLDPSVGAIVADAALSTSHKAENYVPNVDAVHRDALVALADSFAYQYGDTAKPVPFYFSTQARDPQHRIGGPQAVQLQCLLSPNGIDNPGVFDAIAEAWDAHQWDAYPRMDCAGFGTCSNSGLDDLDRFWQQPKFSKTCGRDAPRKRVRHQQPEPPKLQPTKPAQPPPAHSRRRAQARQEKELECPSPPQAEVHPLLTMHPCLMGDNLPALDWDVSDEEEDMRGSAGMVGMAVY